MKNKITIGGGYNGEYYIKENKGYKLLLGNFWAVPLDTYTNGSFYE